MRHKPPSNNKKARPKLGFQSVEVRGALSKLAPPLARIVTAHRGIRRRDRLWSRRRASGVRQRVHVSERALAAAETDYQGGSKLRDLAGGMGISRQHLSSLLRGLGVQLRRRSPSRDEVNELSRRYAQGESLERISARLGFSAGTVRTWLVADGLRMRDMHGRDR